jgi:maltoporin
MLFNDSKARDAATMLGLSRDHVGILLHALGIQCRNGQWSKGGWRNYYNIGEECDSYSDCKVLAVGGWMRGHVYCEGDKSWNFAVTQAGVAALRLCGFRIEVTP